MTAAIAMWTGNGYRFVWNNDMRILDIFVGDNKMPTHTIHDMDFENVDDFIGFCNYWFA